MKHFFVSVGIALTAGLTFAQSDGVNKQKYWKFRSDFRENYVKIGSQKGESLPAGARQPQNCVDNINYDGTGFGTMHWGDGMIRQGHYLGLLATEYRLLQNAQKDVSGVLNELYFALKAFNRNDLRAEVEQAPFHDITLNESTNGFYNREDIPEDFATDNWGTDAMEMRCTNSAYYKNNNAAKLNETNQFGIWFNEGNNYQNTPSQDQMSSLLVGLSLIDKLVDNVWVHPAGEAQGFFIVTEAEQIVDRMVRYCADHNWFIIDVNGWPVNNGGGDLILTAYPMLKIAERITGNSYASYSQSINRRIVNWHDIYSCMTGFGLDRELTSDERDEVCDDLGVLQSTHVDDYLFGSGIAGPLNNQAASLFQAWQSNGSVSLPAGFSANIWSSMLPNTFAAMYNDWYDDHKFNTISDIFPLIEPSESSFFGQIEFDQPPIKDYSATIMFNLGVASGLWQSLSVNAWANGTGNRQLELINTILNNQNPTQSQAFYRSFLDQMPYEGPYHLTESWLAKYQTGGWASEYRWTHPVESVGDALGKGGIYSGIDYMLYHNLYWLVFNGGTQMTETSDQCPCGSSITVTAPVGSTSAELETYNRLNSKLSHLPTCVPSALAPTFNLVTTAYTIQPKFSNYVDWNIFTTKYQLQNATIETGGALTVKTHLVVCDNATVNVKTGAFFYVDKSYTQINVNAAIDVSGELRVRQGTELLVKGKLRLKNGGKLIIEAGAKLTIDYTGVLEYYNGSQIETIGTTSSITLKGTIKTMDATTFQITNSGGGTQSAKLYIDGTAASFQAEVPAYYKLEGKGITDAFVVLKNGTTFKVQDPDIITFRVADCTVEVNGGTSIKAERPYYSYRVKYNSLATNGGLTVSGSHVFNECQFINVPVKAPMNILNISGFTASDCSFAATSSTLNPADNSLVKVTGMSVSMSGCVFTGSRAYCLESSSLTQPSIITGCTFNNLASSGVGATLIGLQDVSNVEYKVTNSTFQKLQYGINKSNGKLTLKCNYFNNNNINNIRVISGCLLNMSINDLAGYNVLNKTLQNKSIEMWSSTINLKNGYNFIEACTNTIYGSVTNTCIPPGCILDFANNQWNAANSIPATSLFQILSGNGFTMLPLVTTVALKPACGYYDGPIVIGPPKTKSTFDTDGMPIIYSTIAADSIRLDDAIVAGMEKMTYYDSLGNDLEAVERFNEVYTSDLDLTDSLTYQLAWFTLEQMKSSLENAVAHGQITIGQNATSFESHVSMYATALMKLSAAEIDESNYLNQFYHEIDKAHLLRVIGHSDKGLNILTELEACGLDSAEQAHLNYWKQEFEKDLVIEEIGFAALDSVIVIDTNGYLNPALVVNAYSFGAIIHSLNDIRYPNCSFFQHRDKKSRFGGLQVAPNPATDEVHIAWSHLLMEGEGVLQIQQADGRIVLSRKIDTNESTGVTLRVSDWNPGVYQIKYRSPKGVVSTAQLVVQ